MMAPKAAIVRSYTLALWPSGPAQHEHGLACTTAHALLANAAALRSQSVLVLTEDHVFDEGHLGLNTLQQLLHCAPPPAM